MIQTMFVGDLSSLTPSGSSPVQSGPTMAKAPLPLPVVRVPGAAKTFVQASIICIR